MCNVYVHILIDYVHVFMSFTHTMGLYKFLISAKLPQVYGYHGYLNSYQQMWPYFFAIGPAFKANYSFTQPPHQLDLYELMCHLLDLRPMPNNGSFDRISHILASNHGFSVGLSSCLFRALSFLIATKFLIPELFA